MRDLGSIADLPNGRFLSDAQWINDQGQVLAIAFVSNIPEPASYALMLAGLGLVGFMTRSKKAIAPHEAERPGRAASSHSGYTRSASSHVNTPERALSNG